MTTWARSSTKPWAGGDSLVAGVQPLPGDFQVEGPSALECSVGVMAFNEEANIASAIESMLAQQMTSGRLAEVVVVASGCEDRTAQIVADLGRRDERVRLLEQKRREGKASAINLFIAAARTQILVMVSADVVVADGTFQALLHHFQDPSVGMVGGHPTPVNEEGTFLGHAVHLQWRLHDRVARRFPKLGEIVAFRNIVPSIPFDTAVDEISIQAMVTQLGYRLVYEPRAVVYNRGPTTVQDFLRQRRRIYAGHLSVRAQQGYSASTMSTARVARALWGSGSFASPRAAAWTLGTIGLEGAARMMGRYDAARRRPQHVWDVCGTTKTHIVDGTVEQQAVAVFHIVDFHRLRLQMGAHTSGHLTRRVADHIKRQLGSKAIVSIRQGGTVVALIPGSREEAEETARRLLEAPLTTAAWPGQDGLPGPVELACAIIAFSSSGPPLARPVALAPLELESAART